MKKLFVFAVALAVFSARPTASAQVAVVSYAVMTVDSVSYDGLTLTVRGVPQGEAAPVSVWIQFTNGDQARQAAASDYCRRLLMLALAKPGQYLVAAGANTCRLQLVTP